MPWHWGWMGLSPATWSRPHVVGRGSERFDPRSKAFGLQRGKGRDMPEPIGFFTDTTVCIGCKACEVAVQGMETNSPARRGSGEAAAATSYDNTAAGRHHWRHVVSSNSSRPIRRPLADDGDVLQALRPAGCLEVCPTGAIDPYRVRHGRIQSIVCNGAGVHRRVPVRRHRCTPGVRTGAECTLCTTGLRWAEPACSKACPTDSIQFGSIVELRTRGA